MFSGMKFYTRQASDFKVSKLTLKFRNKGHLSSRAPSQGLEHEPKH